MCFYGIFIKLSFTSVTSRSKKNAKTQNRKVLFSSASICCIRVKKNNSWLLVLIRGLLISRKNICFRLLHPCSETHVMPQ